jgi:hypothetical protein
MRSFAKILALSTLGLSFNAVGHAQTPSPITTLNCQGSNGAPLTAAVYAYTLSVANHTLTTYLNGTMFNQIADGLAKNGSEYTTCSLANTNFIVLGDATMVELATSGVGANVDAGSLSQNSTKQVFTQVDFTFTSINLAGSSANLKIPPIANQEQKKAYEQFKARGSSPLPFQH